MCVKLTEKKKIQIDKDQTSSFMAADMAGLEKVVTLGFLNIPLYKEGGKQNGIEHAQFLLKSPDRELFLYFQEKRRGGTGRR